LSPLRSRIRPRYLQIFSIRKQGKEYVCRTQLRIPSPMYININAGGRGRGNVVVILELCLPSVLSAAWDKG
jgi:hypothetical protein